MKKTIFTWIILMLMVTNISYAQNPAQQDRSIHVPAEVSRTWTTSILEVTNKQTGVSYKVTVPSMQNYTIPDSQITIKTMEFLPDFIMDTDKDGKYIITSRSNEPNNPALMVEVLESGKTIFSGWIYSKHPTIHPIKHEKYSIILLDGAR